MSKLIYKKFVPISKPMIGKEEANAAYKVINSGWISMGKKVENFEKQINRKMNFKNSIFVNNGTSALHCTLLALEIGIGDEVIVPTLSYISTANAVLYCGAKPVFCDSDSDTFNVSLSDIEKKINSKTKAIITVDLKGQPVDFDKIKFLSKKYNLYLISDSAESFGALYKNKYVGSQFPVHTFSFFANKNITMGEGGLISTNNDYLAKKIRIVRNQGQTKRYYHTLLGNNFRPTDYAAAIGLEQLKKIDFVINEKIKIAKFYNEFFLNYADKIQCPLIPNYATRPSWYMYCIKFNSETTRNNVAKALQKENIETRLSFPPIHMQPLYKKKFKTNNNSLSHAINAYRKFLDIPSWPGMSKNTMVRIAKTICNNI